MTVKEYMTKVYEVLMEQCSEEDLTSIALGFENLNELLPEDVAMLIYELGTKEIESSHNYFADFEELLKK